MAMKSFCTSSRLLILLVLLLLNPALTFAQIYHIDSVGGNDGNSGTSELSAWRSITRVNSHKFQPGDTLLFRRGREWYDVSLKISASDFMIGSYGEGALPRLIGGVLASRWTATANGVYRTYSRQEWGVQLVAEDGRRFYKWVASMESGLAPGTFYFDKKRQELYIKPFDGNDPNGRSIIVGSQNHILELQDAEIVRLTIDHLEISYANRYGISPWWQGGSARQGVVEIANCLFVGNAFSAIALSGKATYEEISIHGNTISMNGAEGIYIGPYSVRSRLLISDNKIGDQGDSEFGWRGEGAKSSFNGDGIDVKQGNHGVMIVRNTVTNLTAGYGIGILSGGSLVENNVIADIHIADGESCGIYVDVGDSLGLTTIRKNKIYGSKSSGIVVRGSAKIHPPVLVEDNDINLSFDDLFAQQIGLTSRNKENITVRLNRGKGGAFGIYLYGDPPRNVVIEDNLLLQTRVAWWLDPGNLEGLTAKRNSVCSDAAVIIEWSNGGRVLDLKRAKEILGSDDSVFQVPCSLSALSGSLPPARPQGLKVR